MTRVRATLNFFISVFAKNCLIKKTAIRKHPPNRRYISLIPLTDYARPVPYFFWRSTHQNIQANAPAAKAKQQML